MSTPEENGIDEAGPAQRMASDAEVLTTSRDWVEGIICKVKVPERRKLQLELRICATQLNVANGTDQSHVNQAPTGDSPIWLLFQ